MCLSLIVYHAFWHMAIRSLPLNRWVVNFRSMLTLQFAQSSLAALGALFTLSKQDPDAIVLLAGHSMLVPSLLLVLHRESTRLWGVRAHNTATHK
jgi:hypothetical protein